MLAFPDPAKMQLLLDAGADVNARSDERRRQHARAALANRRAARRDHAFARLGGVRIDHRDGEFFLAQRRGSAKAPQRLRTPFARERKGRRRKDRPYRLAALVRRVHREDVKVWRDGEPVLVRQEQRVDRVHGFTVPNANTVFDWKRSPGRRMVEGKFERLGESGKCCVSRHSA